MAVNLADALERLASFRIQSSRESQRVFELGSSLLKSNKWKKGNDSDSYGTCQNLDPPLAMINP